MITERDREIINFIYDIGFATIDQVARMYYKECKNSYDLARKRLKKIYEHGEYLKCIKFKETNQILYTSKGVKGLKVSKHNILLIDYLSKLVELGVVMEKIEIEKEFNGVIPDGIISFVFDGYRYYQIIEIQLRHDRVDINRLERVLPLILNYTNGVVPSLCIVQDTNLDYTKDNLTHFKIHQLSTDLKNLAKVLG